MMHLTGVDWKGLNTSNLKQHPQLHTTNANNEGLLLTRTIYKTPTGMDMDGCSLKLQNWNVHNNGRLLPKDFDDNVCQYQYINSDDRVSTRF